MHSLKRFFATLFMCGLLVPSCYASPDGPPTPGETGPSSTPIETGTGPSESAPAAPSAPEPSSAPAGGSSDSGPSDPGTCAN